MFPSNLFKRDEQPLTRRDVVNALLGTSAGGRPEDRLGQELRFQVVGHQFVNLIGAETLGHKPFWCRPVQA